LNQKNNYYVTLIAALFACTGFTLGLVGGAYNFSLSRTITATKSFLFGRTSQAPLSYDFTAELNLTDEAIASIVRPTSAEQFQNLRKTLIQHIWNTPYLPYNEMPREIRSVKDVRWQDMENLEKIDEVIVEIRYSIESISYHFVPKKRLNKLLIFHQGHDGDFIINKETIHYYLKKGFDVIAFSMPLMSRNKPKNNWILTPDFGPIFIPDRLSFGTALHKYIPLLSSSEFNPVQFFFHPVVVTLNYLLDRHQYEMVAMVGLSGGGWTTAILPALDTRIRFSFQIAGSLPFYLRSVRPIKDLGDYEQYSIPLYKIANYLELYLLSSLGKDRIHVQILNGMDPCCFSQSGAKQYGRILPQLMEEMELPGDFRLYMDNTHSDHIISQYSRDLMDTIFDTAKTSKP